MRSRTAELCGWRQAAALARMRSPEAADEYDGYRSGVLRLLREGPPAERIAEHLARIEQTRMDFKTTPEQLLP